MYTEFFNLKEKPFNLNPSPRFLYLGESHREALNLLNYGVMERKGFILLTGEIGTGKTTMVHALLNAIDETVQYIHLSNPLLSPQEFMDYLAFSVFRKKLHFKSKTDFLLEFEEFLRQCLRDQRNAILIIDEAQKLSFELLEEIRLLSNMETGDEKLLNIFLVGQPELNDKLTRPQCLPLLQRISIRYHIPPLDLEGTREYVATRLRIAGAKKGDDIFPKGAVRALYHCSGGYPRMINILADNSLLLGYSKGIRAISPDMVKECYDELNLEGSFSKDSRSRAEPHKPKGLTHLFRHYWKWAAMLLCILVVLALGMSQIGRNRQWRIGGFETVSNQITSDTAANEQAPAVMDKREPEVNTAIKEVQPLQAPPLVQAKEEEIATGETTELNEPKEEQTSPQKADVGQYRSVIVRRGDTLIQLAVDSYGRADTATLELIKRHNPELLDVNRISVGQELKFPSLSVLHKDSTYTVHIASVEPFESAQSLFKKLRAAGYEAYILPINHKQRGKFFRITLGNFSSRMEAEEYAGIVLKKGISKYAQIMQFETW
ncbi:MAG TPA: AAA family ATPase [Desulfatiglandales bacterium]|nr:AAA family ATPase [Desulfatiglandales bacterium]